MRLASLLLLLPLTLIAPAESGAFEIDPGMRTYNLYSLTFGTGSLPIHGAVLSAGDDFDVYEAGEEHWSLPGSFVVAVQGAANGATLRFDGSSGSQWAPVGAVSGYPVANGLAQFTMPAQIPATAWTQLSGPPPTAFYRSGSTTDNLGVAFNLTPPTPSNSDWSGSISWYVLAAAPPSGYPLVSGSDTTFTRGAPVTPSSGRAWYRATLTPTTI